jgi:protein phosphatase 2C family protein 2/3
MEDAHTVVLDLDEGNHDSNTFFAVYDGHGGVQFSFFLLILMSFFLQQGGTVAKFAGQNVHKRLLSEVAYHEKNYEAAMKRAFLGTDEDLLAG